MVQDGDTYDVYGQRNIFLTVTDKNLRSAETELIWLTDYTDEDGITPGVPQLVKLGDNSFLIMWEEYNSTTKETRTNMIMVDGEGNFTSNRIEVKMRLSDCQPIVTDSGMVVWYVSDGSEVTLYTINPDPESLDEINIRDFGNGPHTSGETVIENDIPATCTVAGSYDAVVYCITCENELSRMPVTVLATGHTYVYTDNGDGTHTKSCIEKDDTTTEEHSYENSACTLCEEEHEPVPGEPVIEEEVYVTCKTNGSYEEVIYCTTCNEELSREYVVVPATGHSYTYTDKGDGTHIKSCTEGDDTTTEAHSYKNSFCTLCGEHTHTLKEPEIENEVVATCTKDGSYDKVIYCATCDEELCRETATISLTGHSYSDAWSSDGTYHWYECQEGDGKTGVAVHTFKWVTDQEATENKDGSRHEECIDCGYVGVTEVILATGEVAESTTSTTSATESSTSATSAAESSTSNTSDAESTNSETSTEEENASDASTGDDDTDETSTEEEDIDETSAKEEGTDETSLEEEDTDDTSTEEQDTSTTSTSDITTTSTADDNSSGSTKTNIWVPVGICVIVLAAGAVAAAIILPRKMRMENTDSFEKKES